MNFSHAVKGISTRGGAVREIDSQSEIELGRYLTSSEKSTLFNKFPPKIVLTRIEQVLNLYF